MTPVDRDRMTSESVGPPISGRQLSVTPLFGREALFDGDDEDFEEEEDPEDDDDWRDRARASSHAPFRGESEAPVSHHEPDDADDDDDDDDVREARGVLAMSQSLQSGAAAGGMRPGTTFGGGRDAEEGDLEGEEGEGGGVGGEDDVGGAD